MITYIYTLSYRNSVFYVGKSVDPVIRLYQHKSSKKKSKKDLFVKELIERGESISMKVIDRCPCEYSDIAEEYWVYYYVLVLGLPLKNTRYHPGSANCIRADSRMREYYIGVMARLEALYQSF